MIEKFREIMANRYRVIRENKEREGKKVIGWVCNYIPEELIYAAGMYPVRILGSEGETAQADAHLYSNICSFVRSCVEEGFKGEYDFLDGLVTASTCDHTRRLFDVWSRYLRPGGRIAFTDEIALAKLSHEEKELLRKASALMDFQTLASYDRLLEENGFQILEKEDLSAELAGLPSEMCSVDKGTLGLLLSGQLPEPDFIVGANFPCDNIVWPSPRQMNSTP